MDISRIGAGNYFAGYECKKQDRKFHEKDYFQKTDEENLVENKNSTKQMSTTDIYKDSKTETNIVVKPDGSRVLMVTMSVGGMETTMSLEISKPTDMENNSRGLEAENLKESIETETLAVEEDTQ